MTRTVTVITPENVAVTYPLAGAASRFLAFLIDLLIIVFTLIGVGLAARWLSVGGGGEVVQGLAYVGTFAVLFGYPTFFEMLWGGRTPGKRVFGLRVIRDGGLPVNFTASMARNVLRFLDFGIVPISPPLVLPGLPGLVSLFFSERGKRIGDYAAGTLVIVEAAGTPLGAGHAPALSPAALAFLPAIPNVDLLTREEYRLIRRFTARRASLDVVAQAALAERIARPLMAKLGTAPALTCQLQHADWLDALERRYAEEFGLL